MTDVCCCDNCGHPEGDHDGSCKALIDGEVCGCPVYQPSSEVVGGCP